METPKTRRRPPPTRPGVDVRRLRSWNVAMAVLHLTQGLLMWALSNDFALPIRASFLQGGETGLRSPKRYHGRDGPLVASFLLVSAIAHALLATVARSWYERSLARGSSRPDGSSTRSAPR